MRYYAKLGRPPADLKFDIFETYLIDKTAALGAKFLMENETRARELEAEAMIAWSEIRGTEVKDNQKKQVRWPRFRGRRNRHYA